MQQPAAEAAGEIVLSGRVPITRLIDLCTERLGLAIEYDPSQINGEVQLRLGDSIEAKTLWSLTNAVLASRGLTTITRPGTDVLAVVQSRAAASAVAIESGDRPRSQVPAGYRSVVLGSGPLETARVLSAITALLSAEGSARRIGETSLMLVIDRSDRVDAVNDLVEHLLRPDARVITESVTLSHRDAESVIASVNGLEAQRLLAGAAGRSGGLVDGGDQRSLLVVAPVEAIPAWLDDIKRVDRPVDVRVETYSVPWLDPADLVGGIESIARPDSTDLSGSGERWRVVEDALTRSIRVTASNTEHARITAWLAQISGEGAPTPARVYPIKVRHRLASDLAELIESSLSESGSSPMAAGDPEAADFTTDAAADDPSIVPREQPRTDQRSTPISVDKLTNTLLVTATPAEIHRIRSLVELLDVRQPQVLLEFTLVSLSEGDTRDLGVELQYLVDDAGTLFRLSSLFGLTDIAPDDPSTAVDASGGTAVVLDPSDYSAVIRALATASEGRSLIRPQLLVSNNEEASLDSVEQQPFISTNASDTVATTSFGGTQDAGTTVSVQPQITAGDELTIRYSVSLSAFVGESADPALPPPSQQSTVSSVATIPDGYAIAIGGIASDVEGEAESKVPLLGDIPLLGELFKSRSNSRSSSTFYVLIRAQIMRSESFEDLKYLGGLQADRFGVDDGWPSIEPRVIR